jgi:fructose-specific phosphotransferase system IIC component
MLSGKQEITHLQNVPYLVFPGAVVGGFLAAFAAWWIDDRLVVPATILVFLIGVICAWIVLRKYGLPINATLDDVRRAMQKEKNAPRP